MQVLVIRLDSFQLGLASTQVKAVVQAVAITPLPKRVTGVEGVVNFHGEPIPIYDLRARLGLRPAPVALSDVMVFLDTGDRKAAVRVNEVGDLVSLPDAELVSGRELVPGLTLAEAVGKLAGDLVFVHDLSQFLSAKTYLRLDELLRGNEDGTTAPPSVDQVEARA